MFIDMLPRRKRQLNVYCTDSDDSIKLRDSTLLDIGEKLDGYEGTGVNHRKHAVGQEGTCVQLPCDGVGACAVPSTAT